MPRASTEGSELPRGEEAGAAISDDDGAGRPASGELAVVSVSHAAQHVYVSGLAVAYPFVVSGLHASYAALGIAVGVAGVIGGLLQGLAGTFSRVPARVLLSCQNVGLAVASLAASAATGIAAFGGAVLFGSAVSWPQHPVGSSVLAERYPRRRAYALSWHVAGGSIGTAAVPIVASALIASFGWRVAVGFLAVPLTLGGLLVAWRLRLPAPPAGTRAPSHSRRALRELLHRREVVGAVVAGTIAACGRGLGTLSVFVPAYLKSSLHFHPLTIGVLFTVLVLGSIGGPVLAGHVADRVGRRGVLVVVYLVGAATMAGYVLVGRGVLALGAVGFCVGIFAYAESPLLQAVFSEGLRGLDPRGAFGYYFAVSYGVGSLWIVALGFIVDHAGFHDAFFLMALSFVAAAAVVAWARPSHAARQAAADDAAGAA